LIEYVYECRCDERLRDTGAGCTRSSYTGFHWGLEHLKIETRLIDERFDCVIGECVISIFKVIRSGGTLERMFPTLYLSCKENTERR
jgi:hypothetical protein